MIFIEAVVVVDDDDDDVGVLRLRLGCAGLLVSSSQYRVKTNIEELL